MPLLSEGMEEGTIVRWLVADGEPVTAGQPVVEVETDKATTEREADADGPLWHRAAEGDAVAVGDEVAVIGDGRASGKTPPDVAPEPKPPARGHRPRPVAARSRHPWHGASPPTCRRCRARVWRLHFSFTVSDIERSIGWYTGVLGLELVHRQRQDNDYTRTIVGIPGAVLEVAQFVVPRVPPARSTHVLELVQYAEAPGRREGFACYFHDPDGITLELLQPPAERLRELGITR